MEQLTLILGLGLIATIIVSYAGSLLCMIGEGKVIDIDEAETSFPPVLPSIEVVMVEEEIEVTETVTLPEGFQPRARINVKSGLAK